LLADNHFSFRDFDGVECIGGLVKRVTPANNVGVGFSGWTERTDVFPSNDFAEFVVVNNYLTVAVTGWLPMGGISAIFTPTSMRVIIGN
jgi:hypothetical protein